MKFICVFPNGQNVHLIKDVGMIPYYLYKDGHFESYIAFYEDREKLEYLDNEVIGLKYKKIKKRFRSENLNLFLFLLKNIFVFDVIMLFHPNQYSLPLALLIKILSFGRTKIYFKFDLDSKFDFSRLYRPTLKGRFFNYLMAKVDLLTVESYSDWLQFKVANKFKVEYIPNGLIRQEIKTFDKKNVILTVGRLGTYQKNTEVLLKSFVLADPQNYELHLVGDIEDDFQNYLNAFFEANPNIKEKVKFLGPISDRAKLRSHYEEAKIFVLSSRFEGFPLVLLEAISYGCYVVSSELPSSKDITNNGMYGKLFKNEEYHSLAEILIDLDNGSISTIFPEVIQKYANEKYDWSILVERISSFLK